MEAAASPPDAAWASVDLSVAPGTVLDLLADPVLLLRLNPCLDFERIERGADGGLRFAAHNESNDRRFETEARVLANEAAAQLVLTYSTGIKRETRFQVEPMSSGSRLKITEVYATPAPDEQDRRLVEVDRSLTRWTASLRRHLERVARYQWLPGYRWWSCRFWPSMSPRHRRVAWLLTWTTAVEFLVFAAVLAVYLAARG